ncbi:MAG: hypothetical protein JKY94_09915 [Rhodobacteraceae bacterium]|nr:hypothetical protein [Paracoccaceae bacterium]
MTVDKAFIVAAALGRFAVTLNIDLEDDDPRAFRLSTIYDETVSFAFGLHTWSWLKATVKCTMIDKVSNGVAEADNWPTGFAYAHAVPGDKMGAIRKITRAGGGVIRDFDLEGERLFTNYPEIWIAARFAKIPELWPDEWRSAFIHLLAGEYAVPESANEELEEKFLTRSIGTRAQRHLPGGMFGRLIAQDQAENPPDSPLRDGDPLTNAHHSGNAGNWSGRY